MSQNRTKVINHKNTTKDIENYTVDMNYYDSDHSISQYTLQACENCLSENNHKRELCTYCCLLQKSKEILQLTKDESPKRDYDTNKINNTNAKEADMKSLYNSNYRGFSIDNISLEGYDSVEKATTKLYCKDCVELSRFKIIQNKLVYITGLAPEIASENVLQKPEYLGQYGKIAKILISENQHQGCFTAIVAYCKEDEALTAILALDQINLLDKTIRACSGNLLCCLNPYSEMPNICAGGCVDVNLLEDEKDEMDSSKNSKSMMQFSQTPKLQHILSVLSKQQPSQEIKSEESVFPSIANIIQNIKKILSEISKNEEQSSSNVKPEEKEVEIPQKTETKPTRKGLRLPDKKSENSFYFLPILEKLTLNSKDREPACTETMTVMSSTETCETNRSKFTENDLDTPLNENDEDEIIRKEFDYESPVSAIKNNDSTGPKQLTEEFSIKRILSGGNNSLSSSQRFDLLTSPAKSLIEDENETSFDIDKRILESMQEKGRQLKVSRFSFAQLEESTEFEELAQTIKKHTVHIEFKQQTDDIAKFYGSETVKPANSFFDIGETPQNANTCMSVNERNVEQIEAYFAKLNKVPAKKLRNFNPDASQFVSMKAQAQAQAQTQTQPKKVELKPLRLSAAAAEPIKKKVAALNSSNSNNSTLTNSTQPKNLRPNKINNNYIENAETDFYSPYFYPPSYEANMMEDMHAFIQDWGYGLPVATITVAYPEIYYLPYY